MPWAEPSRRGRYPPGSPRQNTPTEPPGPTRVPPAIARGRKGGDAPARWVTPPLNRYPGFTVKASVWLALPFFHGILPNSCLPPPPRPPRAVPGGQPAGPLRSRRGGAARVCVFWNRFFSPPFFLIFPIPAMHRALLCKEIAPRDFTKEKGEISLPFPFPSSGNFSVQKAIRAAAFNNGLAIISTGSLYCEAVL